MKSQLPWLYFDNSLKKQKKQKQSASCESIVTAALHLLGGKLIISNQPMLTHSKHKTELQQVSILGSTKRAQLCTLHVVIIWREGVWSEVSTIVSIRHIIPSSLNALTGQHVTKTARGICRASFWTLQPDPTVARCSWKPESQCKTSGAITHSKLPLWGSAYVPVCPARFLF